jgi:hypothetical protein
MGADPLPGLVFAVAEIGKRLEIAPRPATKIEYCERP